MKKFNKGEKIRLVILAVFIFIMLAVTVAAFPYIRQLTTAEGREKLLLKIESFGSLKYLVYVIAQIFQIIFAFIPGEPFEIIAGVMFGFWGGSGMCLFAMLLGTISVYYIVKLLGKPFVSIIMSEDKLSRFKFLQDNRRFELLVFILFLIPGTPKDALTYFAPFTTLKPSRFFLLSTVARIPSVVSSVIVGATLNDGNIALSIAILALTAAIGVAGIWYNNKFMAKLEESERIKKAREKKAELQEKIHEKREALHKKNSKNP